MKIKLYAIKDLKQGYNMPFTMVNDEVALRTFRNEVKDIRSNLNLNPEDYELFKVGEFDTMNAELFTDVKYLASGMEFKTE